MSRTSDRRGAASMKHVEKTISPRQCVPEKLSAKHGCDEKVAARPVCGALIDLERRCADLELVASKLEERLEQILYPGPTGSGCDEGDPSPVVSPVVESIHRASDRLAMLRDQLECLISRIEC